MLSAGSMETERVKMMRETRAIAERSRSRAVEDMAKRAHELGLTTDQIPQAVGVSRRGSSPRVRSARVDRKMADAWKRMRRAEGIRDHADALIAGSR